MKVSGARSLSLRMAAGMPAVGGWAGLRTIVRGRRRIVRMRRRKRFNGRSRKDLLSHMRKNAHEPANPLPYE